MSSSKKFVVISGIGPSLSGTGRFMIELVRFVKSSSFKVDFLFKPTLGALLSSEERFRLRRRLSFIVLFRLIFRILAAVPVYVNFEVKLFYYRRFAKNVQLLIFHPQTLGFVRTIQIIESQRTPPFMYLLDNSFFCIRSYNHKNGADKPCFDCRGGPSVAAASGCVPFPVPDQTASEYVDKLRILVSEARVKLLAQNKLQSDLAASHFQLNEPPPVIGLWTNDFDEILALQERSEHEGSAPQYDVVFHGHNLEAKGAHWLMDLATRLPHLRFLFPFPQTAPAPENCEFKLITWESGLKEVVMNASIVAVPSLWSAPIEGALVKSLFYARRVAVVDSPFSFQAELSGDLVLRLSPDLDQAAEQLSRDLRVQDELSDTVNKARSAWMSDFLKENRDCCERLFNHAAGRV